MSQEGTTSGSTSCTLFGDAMQEGANPPYVVEQILGVPVPQIMEDNVDGVQAVPQGLVPNRVGEQIGATPVPQIKEVISERTQIVNMPLLQTMGTSPRSASRSVHRSPMCQCRRSKERSSHPFPRFGRELERCSSSLRYNTPISDVSPLKRTVVSTSIVRTPRT